jgi:hypothetical protein
MEKVERLLNSISQTGRKPFKTAQKVVKIA